MEQPEVTIDNQAYEATIRALVSLPATLLPGEDMRDGVIRVLGEIGGVWPASVKQASA